MKINLQNFEKSLINLQILRRDYFKDNNIDCSFYYDSESDRIVCYYDKKGLRELTFFILNDGKIRIDSPRDLCYIHIKFIEEIQCLAYSCESFRELVQFCRSPLNEAIVPIFGTAASKKYEK